MRTLASVARIRLNGACQRGQFLPFRGG